MSNILRIPIDRELGERVSWLIALRWIVLTIATAVGLIANRWLNNVLPGTLLWIVLVAVALYNIIFWLVDRRMLSRPTSPRFHIYFMHVQIIVDLLALTTLLHFAGGIENPFSVYYVLLVVIGSILTTQKAGYLYATIASLLWTGLLVAEAAGLLPHYNLQGFRSPQRYRQVSHLFAESFVIVSANFGIAYLSSSIIKRLRKEEQELYEANRSCQLRAAELSRLNERLQELDHTRSLFIRLVTHELRAPVAAIQSYLQLILEGYVPEERMMEIVSKAERRAREQLDLISDLLSLARLSEAKEEEEIEPSDAVTILRDVLDMMQGTIEDKNLSTEIDVQADELKVMVPETHVKQIWNNLISNAIKYTPAEGAISITLEDGENTVLGTVQDTGIGISPEEQDSIFEDFYRTEAAKSMAQHGTGLGLSIVKAIMERYNGRIWVESEQGEGSTFYFELPKDD
ncbi:MAG: HAMP domain-containing sensor histidine kinase [Anaerolineae bacterium]